MPRLLPRGMPLPRIIANLRTALPLLPNLLSINLLRKLRGQLTLPLRAADHPCERHPHQRWLTTQLRLTERPTHRHRWAIRQVLRRSMASLLHSLLLVPSFYLSLGHCTDPALQAKAVHKSMKVVTVVHPRHEMRVTRYKYRLDLLMFCCFRRKSSRSPEYRVLEHAVLFFVEGPSYAFTVRCRASVKSCILLTV